MAKLPEHHTSLYKDIHVKKRILFLCIIFSSQSLLANELSGECIRAMQSVYKFYYQEIQPKNADDTAGKLADPEEAHMQLVINELKTHCSPELIAQMNQSLREDNS